MAASSNAQLSALRVAKPAEFALKVRAALEQGGSVPAAAKQLGVTPRTLFRWIADAPALIEGLALPPPRAILRGSHGARELAAKRSVR